MAKTSIDIPALRRGPMVHPVNNLFRQTRQMQREVERLKKEMLNHEARLKRLEGTDSPPETT